MEMWHQKNLFTTRRERKISLKRFVNWYNTVKPHKGIENQTPYEVIEQFYYPQKV
jgi:transposase InsO family protein